MTRLRMTRHLEWMVGLAVIATASRADAFPAFARKYGMSCSACHVAWPIFNQQGQNFRDNGYQFQLGKDDPVTLSQAYIPVSLRTTSFYQFTRTTNQPSDQGPIVTTTGGVPLPPGVDILTGGTIARDLSFLVVVSGFGPDGTASMESAWARLDNLGGAGWLNLRVGKFELDQPASAHRNVALIANYAVYSAHPVGSLVGFDVAENQAGIELDGHDARSLTRYSIAVVSANGDPGGKGAWSSPLVWAHVQRAFELDSSVLPWVRIGALGAVGWWPTSFNTVTDASGAVTNVPGTGTNMKNYYRAGAELSWMFGYPSTPALFTAAYMYGRENAGLAQGTDAVSGADLSTVTNSFHGGFLEVDWVPFSVVEYNATPWLFFARYDIVRYNHGAGDLDGGTLGARRYLALGPRAAMAIHVEVHADRTKGIGAPDPANPSTNLDVQTQSVLAGLDFDF